MAKNIFISKNLCLIPKKCTFAINKNQRDSLFGLLITKSNTFILCILQKASPLLSAY